jgi:hypothetical protein
MGSCDFGVFKKSAELLVVRCPPGQPLRRVADAAAK